VLSYFQAIVIGALQGVTELFPISSLGHSVVIPKLLGWDSLAKAQSQSESFYLAFIVALHVATALALLVYFRDDWVRIIGGFFRSLGPSVRARHLLAADADERLAWLIVIATIPAGITGLLLEHTLRTLFAKPFAAAVFLTFNGVILTAAEYLRRRAPAHRPVAVDEADAPASVDVAIGQQVGRRDAGLIGLVQTLALLPGISRSGVTMSGGLLRGLTHEEAVRFSFLLATPIILAAGLLKVPDLVGPLGNGIRGQVAVGSVAAFVAALVAARFLERWFRTRTLMPFAVYCLIAGGISILRFA
jgi:undecaprenyl-diphosphatase